MKNSPQNEPKHKLHQMRLNAIPDDVRTILLRAQLEKKISCNCQFSLEQTVYMLLRKAGKEE